MDEDTQSLLKLFGIVFAAAAFMILWYFVASADTGDGITQEIFLKDLVLSADSMMNNEGEFSVNYTLGKLDLIPRADYEYIYVKLGKYEMKHSYFRDKDYIIDFTKNGADILMEKKYVKK